MSKKLFEFLVYRLNLTPEPDLLRGTYPKVLKTDEDLVSILKDAATAKYDIEKRAKTCLYRWGLRVFETYPASISTAGRVVVADLARSTVSKEGKVVTDQGVVDGDSQAEPPLASLMRLFFFAKRHMIAAEFNSQLMSSNAWREVLSEMISKAANVDGYGIRFEAEPVPSEAEIIRAFRGFDRLTRLRLHLRLPNPDLSRYARKLYDELRGGGIREYLQDMKNYSGLSQDDDQLPFASATIAQSGYKKGEVRMEGTIGGKHETVITGKHAARGTIDKLRDFVRGLKIGRRSKEAQQVISAISKEIDRIAPPEDHAE